MSEPIMEIRFCLFWKAKRWLVEIITRAIGRESIGRSGLPIAREF